MSNAKAKQTTGQTEKNLLTKFILAIKLVGCCFLLLSFEITKEMCDRYQRSKANALIKSRKETDKHLNSMVQVSNDYCVFCVSFSSLVLLSLSCIQNNLFRQHANFVQTLQIFVGQNKVKKKLFTKPDLHAYERVKNRQKKAHTHTDISALQQYFVSHSKTMMTKSTKNWNFYS